MSIKHMNDVWGIPFRSREKVIALAIADCANDNGVAWPGYDLLLKKTGLARATLAAGIKKLSEFGWCVIENHSEFGKGKKVNVYLIKDNPKVQYMNNRQNLSKSSVAELATKSSVAELPKVQFTLSKSSVAEHETPLEPPIKENHHIKKKFNAIESRPDFIPQEHWEALLKNRKFKKLQNTELALKKFVNSLLDAVEKGFKVEDCIEEYVSCSWQRFNHEWMNNVDSSNSSKKCASCDYLYRKSCDGLKNDGKACGAFVAVAGGGR